MNCRTCKHWTPLPNDAAEEADHRDRYIDSVDLCVPWAPNSGVCGRANLPEYGSDPFDDSLMFVQDGSGYRACLVTRDTFGCVLHEP